MSSDTKEIRHRAIHKLVAERQVHTQTELAEALTELGLGATQATVSRDIQELGLVRTPAGYRNPVAAGLGATVLGVTVVQFLAVVRTPPGAAQMVARALDENPPPGVVGTVAGDDTIVVVLRDTEAGEPLRRMLLHG